MKYSRRIVVCGVSIYMLAIESGLSAMEAGDIVRIDPNLPDTVERIRALEPQVVIMEMNKKNDGLALEILCLSIPLIFLDEAQRSISVLTRELVPNNGINELTSVIEKINQAE